jgi:hypothetical protein
MQHDGFCEKEAHRPPPDATTRPERCVGPIGAEVQGIAAWLSGSDRGTVVNFDHERGVSLPVQAAAEFAQQLLVMALRGGAVLPGPRPATGHA